VRVFAGIDGGQSSTNAVVGNENGEILAHASAAPADLVGEARDSKRQATVLDGVLAAALQEANLPSATRFAAIVAGISGYDEGEAAEPALQTQADGVRFVHDAVIAHAGALDGEPGIVVLAGTGSVAYGTSASGAAVRAGGWGYLFGDAGSAFWIGRYAIHLAMHDEDLDLGDSRWRRRILGALGLPTLRAVQHAFAHGELTRARIAALAPVALAEGDGHPYAQLICGDAAERLVQLVQIVGLRLGSDAPLVSYAGGLFANEAVKAGWEAGVRREIPTARVVAPRYDPVLGALRLAYQLAGLQPDLRGVTA